MNPLALNESGKTILAMGNDAIVRGGLEAGLGYFSTYPGTPASEIGEGFAALKKQFPHIHTEFSVNEHVAAHGAQGASWANIRSMVTMKHVGMNVASEVLHFAAYSGVKAGFVVVIGSDPGATSSTSEQDDRWYSLHTHLPILEPATIQEAKDFTIRAFELSEQYNLPVILNAPSKLCHNIGSLTLGELPREVQEKGHFERNPTRYINLFGGSVANHRRALESIDVLEKDIPSLSLNKVVPASGKTGFISSSINYLYLMEALALLDILDAPVLKIGISYPLNVKEISEFAEGLDDIIVVEELEGFLEYQIKQLLYDTEIRTPVKGKQIFPRYGELDVDIIAGALSRELGKPLPEAVGTARDSAETLTRDIPPRQGSFCTGCPHRATLYSIVKATDRKVIFAGDIGCYTLSCLPPFSAFDWVTCMNCGVGIAQGMLQKIEGEKVIAYVGDSTFFHSGIPNVINAVQQNADLVLVILDNKWVAMTGHQPSPTTNVSIHGEKLDPVDIKGLLKSIGVKYIRSIDPFNIKGSIAAVRDALRQEGGVRVIIAEQECALQYARRIKINPPEYKVYYQIEEGRCQLCNECYVDLGCPAIRKDYNETGHFYYIEEAACLRCGSCRDLCPNGAIVRTEIKLHPGTARETEKVS
ncbi:MAG TPA: thiamine pyrophosphate-dependent enzyme [Spirochaetota bacterium]|nr:thiamine pyrophosphate-dependent enzyme [Spirochaetota bacterium]HPJ38339.1 thiamine pyrophosphate-dependent enzyme [Spirochaetota bacterium]HPQ53080.1 thiamine pyrophosphate-dependent enzyme [Spirochaetota bacterium]